MAAGNAGMMGNAQRNYNLTSRQMQLPFQNQAQSAQDQFNQMIRQEYNNQMTNYYNSPNAFTNMSNPFAGITNNSSAFNNFMSLYQ